jgi:rSAM/selenodomain-associated transferase 1
MRACVIVGKAPVAGQAKTRLVPPLTPEGAAALYAAFLRDAVELAQSLNWERVSVIHPAGDHDVLRAIIPANVSLVEQSSPGLGSALSQAFAHHFDHDFKRVVLIGSDNPTLPAEPVRAASDALDRADLAIGPTADGGWYLLAMRRFHAELLENIEWSTSRVYSQTLANANRLGLTVEPVAACFDVDEPHDLARLRSELEHTAPAVARHTRAALYGTSTVGDRPVRSA